MTSSPGLREESRPQARRGVLQTTTDDRRKRPLLVWPPTLYVGGPVTMLQKLTETMNGTVGGYSCNCYSGWASAVLFMLYRTNPPIKVH